MRQRLLLVNGPNLNLLGVREPHVYGRVSLADAVERASAAAERFGFGLDAVQSNHEGVLVDALHSARSTHVGVLINPGGLTHTSVVLRDALSGVALPVVEVHISNVHRREGFRHRSLVSGVADAVIAGAGVLGYQLGVEVLVGLATQAAVSDG